MNAFAVAGHPISHSMSPLIMEAAMQHTGYDGIYTRILTPEPGQLIDLISFVPFRGLNITAPLKKAILSLAGRRSPEVAALGAANAMVKTDAGWTAYNTDVDGVGAAWERTGKLAEKEVLLIGAGGAAAAVLFALRDQGARVFVTNRSEMKLKELSTHFSFIPLSLHEAVQQLHRFYLVINATSELPQVFQNTQLLPDQWWFDAPYKESPGLKLCAPGRHIGGRDWLTTQAVRSFELFTGQPINREVFDRALNEKGQKRTDRIVLTGPMGSGKSSIGRLLAQMLGFDWIDLDARLEEKEKKSIAKIFEEEGEAYFRHLESAELARSLIRGSTVVSTGGGVVLDPANRKWLKEVHTVCLLVDPQTTVNRTRKTERPLLRTNDPLETASGLFTDRLPYYLGTAHVLVNARNQTPENISALILADYQATYGLRLS